MKAAIYIEQKSAKTKEPLYWAGYIYANEEVVPEDFTFVKDSFDQFDKPVKVYRAGEATGFEFPGGTKQTDLVVLF